MNTERKPGYYPISPRNHECGTWRIAEWVEWSFGKFGWRYDGILYSFSQVDVFESQYEIFETPISPEPQGMTREELIEKAKHALFNYNYDCDNDRAVDIAVYMVDFALSLSPVAANAMSSKSDKKLDKIDVTDEEISKMADTKFPTNNENTAIGQTFAIKQQYGFEVGARWMRSKMKGETK